LTCAHLFDRNFIDTIGLRFEEDIRIGEGGIWNARCLAASRRISAIDACVYLWNHASVNSLMRPLSPVPAHFRQEARSHFAVASILREACSLAFVLYYTDHLNYRRTRIAEAMRYFTARDAAAVIAEYSSLYRLAPPLEVFGFARKRRLQTAVNTRDLVSFAQLLADGDEAGVRKAARRGVGRR
jgi:hypothetical protein